MLDHRSYTTVFPGQAWRQRSTKIPESLIPPLKVLLLGNKLKTLGYAYSGGFGAAVITVVAPELVLAAAGGFGSYFGVWFYKKLSQGRDAGLDHKDDRSGKVDLDYGNLKFFRQREKDWHTDGINSGKADNKSKDGTFDLDTGSHTTTEWKDKIYATTDDTNTKSTTPPQFVFMDCGRWKGEARDFGLVWGRHVYLCHYEYTGFGAKINNPIDSKIFDPLDLGESIDKYKDRLDFIFFKTFDDGAQKNTCGKIKIQAYSYAEYGEDTDYDWSKATVIIPDLHLMSMEDAKIWYKLLSPGYFKLDAETALLNFAETLIKIGWTKLNVVQIGDSYDLWVGGGVRRKKSDLPKEPLFNKNNDQKFSLDHGQSFYLFDSAIPGIGEIEIHDFENLPVIGKSLLTWNIKLIQIVDYKSLKEFGKQDLLSVSNAYKNWRDLLTANERKETWFYDGVSTPIPDDKFLLNPAEVAMRILERAFPDMKYIYGNHDNYLIEKSVTRPAELKERVAMVEDGYSLFIEHAHRMEADLSLPGLPDFVNNNIPKNHDGSWSGFETTCELYLAEKYWKDGNPSNADDQKKNKDQKELQNGKSEVADRWAALDNQSAYLKKYAEFWMGRKSLGKKDKKPYNITVIGHTHMPALFNYFIDAPPPPPAPTYPSEEENIMDHRRVPVGDGIYMDDPFYDF